MSSETSNKQETAELRISEGLKDKEFIFRLKNPDNTSNPYSKYKYYTINVFSGRIVIPNSKTVYVANFIRYLRKNNGLSMNIPVELNLEGGKHSIDWNPIYYKGKTMWEFQWKLPADTNAHSCFITGNTKKNKLLILVDNSDNDRCCLIIEDICRVITSLWVPEKVQRRIYEWVPQHRQYAQITSEVQEISQKDLVGIDEHFESINSDVKTLIEKKEQAIRLGANAGYNYLLHGRPGTGKSSFVKALANMLGLPIYVVKSENIKEPSAISKILCPPAIAGSNFQIVLVEDFDRFLKSADGDKVVSELLNALDGIYPAFGTFRFFSANNPELINDNRAMITRMRKVMRFDALPISQVDKFLNSVFPENGKDISAFCELIDGKNFTMREINNYVSRFLVEKNPIKSAIENFDRWIEEKNSIHVE